MAINLVDVILVIALLVGLANGYRRGFWLSLFQYVGLVLGVIVGVLAIFSIFFYPQYLIALWLLAAGVLLFRGTQVRSVSAAR